MTGSRADEETGPNLPLPYISGVFATDGTGMQMAHTITLNNLQSNTLYYYATRGIDSGSNMSMTWPSTFQTNQY